MSGLLQSANHTSLAELQNLDPSLPTSDKNASSHPAVQRRLTSDLPVSHHLTQREPSMIDDTCINHEAGDRDTNAEQSQKQHRGVYRVWWMKKTAKSRKKKLKNQSVSHHQRVWYQSEILNPKLKERELWNCGDHTA